MEPTPAAQRWNWLLAFSQIPVPDEPGPRRNVLLTLRIQGWVVLAMAALGAMMMVFAVFAAIIGLSIFEAMTPWFGDGASGGFGALIALAMLFGLIVMIGFGLVLLWWTGWVMQHVYERRPDAGKQVMVMGIVFTVLGGLGVMGALAGGVPLQSLVTLGFGIAHLVQYQGLQRHAPAGIEPA